MVECYCKAQSLLVFTFTTILVIKYLDINSKFLIAEQWAVYSYLYKVSLVLVCWTLPEIIPLFSVS